MAFVLRPPWHGSYSWHATQEHWGFSQGITSITIIIILLVILLVLLLVIARTSLSNCSNPGARSSIYVLLDAF